MKNTFFAPSFRFTMQHTLTKDISLSYNLGAEMNGVTAEPIFIYTLTTGFSFSEKFGTYVELYGFAPQNNISEHRADGGITYYVHPNILVDLSGGVGLTENAPQYYTSIGFSLRMPN